MKRKIIKFLTQVMPLLVAQTLQASEPIHDNNCLKAALKASTKPAEQSPDLINPYFVTSSLGKNLKSRFEVKNFFDEMKKCVSSMPERELKEMNLKKALKAMGVSGDFSVTAYVASAGEKEVNWENLPPEMSLNSAATLLNPLFDKGKGTLFLKYFKMAIPEENDEGVEASFYYFNSVNKMGKDVLSKKKGSYNSSWNEQDAIAKMGIFNLLIGLQCLYPDHKITTDGSSLQFIYKGPTSYGYFILRNILGKNSQQKKL